MLGKKIIGAALLLLLLLASSSSGQATTQSPELTGLRQSVLALDSAWSTALKDLQQKKLDNVLQESERKDYAKFITFLGTRIDEYCQLLRENGGSSATIDLPCPDSGSTGSGLDKNEPAQSSSEQIAALDQSLSEALGGFDELLLKEEERLAQRMPRQRESGQGYDGSQGRTGGQNGSRTGSGQTGSGRQNGNQGSGQNPSGSTGQEQGTGGMKQDGSQSGQGSQASGGEGAGAGTGQTDNSDQQGGMTEIESGYDDIVARQLREAAEKETDPELKEKLWEEYRKYKKGAL